MSEVYRVLKKGGRFILFIGSKDRKGMPAEPDPISADCIKYYGNDELIELARKEGFSGSRVKRPTLDRFAKEEGMSQEAMELFSGPGGGGDQFLSANKR